MSRKGAGGVKNLHSIRPTDATIRLMPATAIRWSHDFIFLKIVIITIAKKENTCYTVNGHRIVSNYKRY